LPGETEFSHRTRAAALAAMADQPVDLLIVGGGITGAGIARDAALRGLRVAVVDKGDVGGGTSSRSSRLIHGGLRYLEQREFHLVFEACRERRLLLRAAPHLVRPLAFLFPAYRGQRVPAWQLRAGMWLYDLLAAFRNVHPHRWLSAAQVRGLEPTLRDKNLLGGGRYYDAQTDDARLTLAIMRSAAQARALVASYAAVEAFDKADGRIGGAVVRDLLSGTARTVHARVVVNATGPWVDRVRRLDEPGAPPLLRPTKGAHLFVPRARLGHTNAITLFSPLDGRVMFVLPWGGFSYVGTTDTDTEAPPEEIRASGEDVTYLLRSANAIFPQARLTPKDVLSTWAGLRPLLAPAGGGGVSASQVSREHRIVESASGLVTIAGGKLTTYRVMGRQVVELAAKRLYAASGLRVAPAPPTDTLPLPGGETADLEGLVKAAQARGVNEATARHLVLSYGSESAAILNLAEKNRVLAGPIIRGRPEIRAEVVHAVEREMALHLSDVLMRRLPLFYEDPARASNAAAHVAHKMAELLGWDGAREEEEIGGYLDEVRQSQLFIKEVGRQAAVAE